MFNEAFAGTLPLQATEVASKWDVLYNFLVSISVFFFILVVGGMIFFAIKYRKSANIKTKYITGSHALEALWTIIPTVLLLMIFGWGYYVYNAMTQAPTEAYEVRVIGKQWLWQFQYDDGRTTIGELYVPANKPVKLIMTSQDVIHSFFVPNFRVKQDVVPGMYTSVWFEATMPGKHQIFCTEYCGTSHSEMLGKVIVLEDQDWNAWKRGKKIGPIADAGAEGGAVQDTTALARTNLVDRGRELFNSKGCMACHSLDGSAKVGPSHKGIFGRKEELTDGSTVTVDENYIRESIENPQAKIVKGFNPVMPPFKGMLNEEEMNALIAFLKSVK